MAGIVPLPEVRRVLEIGAGYGRLAYLFASLFPSVELHDHRYFAGPCHGKKLSAGGDAEADFPSSCRTSSTPCRTDRSS